MLPIVDGMSPQFIGVDMNVGLLGALITMGVLSACTGGAVEARRGAPVDSAGVLVSTGPATDDTLPWRFTEVTQFGGADTGALAFEVAAPYNVTTDGRSQIAVLDGRRDNRVHVFNASGVLLRSVGGRGGGPGELEIPLGLEFEPDGRLSVRDAAKSALVAWDSVGRPLTERRLGVNYGRVWGMPRLRGDTVWAAVDLLDSTKSVRRLERWTPRDTLNVDSVVGARPTMVTFKCVGLALPPLLTGELIYAPGGTAVAVANQSRYVIDVVEQGKRVRSIRRAITGAPTSPEDALKVYPEGLKVRFGGGRECVTPAAEVAQKMGMASTLPVVRAMTFAPTGELWVERYVFEGETPRTDVFDRDGRYLGTVFGRSLPLGFLGADTVLFSVPDADNGTSRIGVYRVAR